MAAVTDAPADLRERGPYAEIASARTTNEDTVSSMFHVSRRSITLSLLVAGLVSAAASSPASASSHHGLLPAVQLTSVQPGGTALLLPAVQSAREAARRAG